MYFWAQDFSITCALPLPIAPQMPRRCVRSSSSNAREQSLNSPRSRSRSRRSKESRRSRSRSCSRTLSDHNSSSSRSRSRRASSRSRGNKRPCRSPLRSPSTHKHSQGNRAQAASACIDNGPSSRASTADGTEAKTCTTEVSPQVHNKPNGASLPQQIDFPSAESPAEVR